jgi:xylobiose transport system permease protein
VSETATLDAPADQAAARPLNPFRRVNVLGTLAALVWLVVVGVPLYFLVVSSVRRSGEYLSQGALAPPTNLTADNYVTILTSDFPRYFLNNAIVTAGCVAIVVVLALPAAYAIVRSKKRSVSMAFSVMLLGLAVPSQAVIVPLYLLITQFRLYDTLLAIILPTAAFALPLSILVLTASVRDVPRELYEAMNLDGAGSVRALFSLVLPLSRPALATIAIYTAMQAWNGFLFPLVLTQDPSVRVLTLGLWDFQGQFGLNVPVIMAAVALSLLPLLVVYLLGRRYLLAGLTAGSGK